MVIPDRRVDREDIYRETWRVDQIPELVKLIVDQKMEELNNQTAEMANPIVEQKIEEWKNNNKHIQTKEDASEITTKKELIKQRAPVKGIVIKEPTGHDQCDPVPASNDKGKKPMEAPKPKNNSELADTGAIDTAATAGVDYSIKNQQIWSPRGLPVKLFWDIENCQIPKGVNPRMVKNNVLMSLKQYHLNMGSLQSFSAYGDFNLIPTVRKGLHNAGVQLVVVPSGRKDAADIAILCDMFEFVLDNPPPAILVLISGDVDLSLALNRIGELGYQVIVAGVNVSQYFYQPGRCVFDWTKMALGKGCVELAQLPSTADIKKAHGQTSGVNCLTMSDPALNLQNRSSPYSSPLLMLCPPLLILWDVHSCPIPKDINPRMVKENVLMYLREHSVTWSRLMFHAYGDFKLLSTIREELYYSGVKLFEVPSGKKSAANKAMLLDMYEFARLQPSPAQIMLISRDLDFARALHGLGDRGYVIIIAVPSGVSSYLCQAGKHVWDWLIVASGKD